MGILSRGLRLDCLLVVVRDLLQSYRRRVILPLLVTDCDGTCAPNTFNDGLFLEKSVDDAESVFP